MDENGRDVVEAMFRKAIEQQREQEQKDRELVEQVFKEAMARNHQAPVAPAQQPRGIHYTELAEAKPGDTFFHEWNTYRKEVGRLLAEGHEGRHVLIKGQEIIAICDTWDEARHVGLTRYHLEPFFVHPIRAEEPYLRVRGLNYPWPSLLSQ